MYRIMDKQEIEINQIDNLKMIHIYDLATAGGAVGDDNQKAGTGKNHVPALAVYYGDNKQINLCVMDNNYNLLMERVLSLYSQCENKDLIIIDEATRKLLDLACHGVDHGVSSVARIGKKYMDMKAEQLSRFNTEGYIRKLMLPMLKYYISQLYGLWDMEIIFKDGETGWHGNVVLCATHKNKDLCFPVHISHVGLGKYNAVVGNFVEEKNTVIFEIVYKSQSLKVDIISEDYCLSGDSRFDFSLSTSACITNIKVDGAMVYCSDESIGTVSAEEFEGINIKYIFELDKDKSKLYRLPWGGYYSCTVNKSVDGSISQWDYDTGFCEKNDKSFFARQYAWSFIENISTNVSISSGGGMMERLIPDLDKGLMQTIFLPVGYYSGWDYKQKLENRFFYEEIKE